MPNICILQTGTWTEIPSIYTTLQVRTHSPCPCFWQARRTKTCGNPSNGVIQTQLIELDMLLTLPSRSTAHYNGFPSCCHSPAVDTVAFVAPYRAAQTHTLRRIPPNTSLPKRLSCPSPCRTHLLHSPCQTTTAPQTLTMTKAPRKQHIPYSIVMH